MTHRIFVTGAAGYIGSMLCDLFSRRADVDLVVALDKEPMPEALRHNAKIRWIQANTIDGSWQDRVAGERPDIVIHLAWQIRELYGQAGLQRRWNVDGADAVFDFVFNTPSVGRLLHFSTVTSSGPQAENRSDRMFTEQHDLRACDFSYAEEKRIVERNLEARFALARGRGSNVAVAVLRPATVSGPRGRARGAGQLRQALGRSSRTPPLPSWLAAPVPVTADWCRQFVHEDDLADCTALLAFADLKNGYDVFNVGPTHDLLRAEDMARVFRKRTLRVHPELIRFAFFLLWHGTRGRVATPRGAWRAYCYPLVVDSAKLTAVHGFRYRMGSREAFLTDGGRYARMDARQNETRATSMVPAGLSG